MAWFSRKPKDTTGPLLARLYQLTVVEPATHPSALPESFLIPEGLGARFSERLTLYREAAFYYLLTLRAHDDQVFVPILKSFENTILPTRSTSEGEAVYQSITAAMDDLAGFLDNFVPDHHRDWAWSERWFERIGFSTSTHLSQQVLADYIRAMAQDMNNVLTAIEQAAKS